MVATPPTRPTAPHPLQLEEFLNQRLAPLVRVDLRRSASNLAAEVFPDQVC